MMRTPTPMLEPPSFAHLATFGALTRAARSAARGKVLSNETARFLLDIEPECLRLRDELHQRTYAPQAYRTFTITDPKPRTISAAAFRDRVVHHALCREIVPWLERDASPFSYACRLDGGQQRALHQLQRHVQGGGWVLSLDIEHFFETLSHEVLGRLLARRLRHDPDLIWLAMQFVKAGAPGSESGCGVPIGNLTSQHFSNFYLGPLDRFIQMTLRLPFVRYMDDLRVFGTSSTALWTAHSAIQRFVSERLALQLKSSVTRVSPVELGVPFLGFQVFGHMKPFDNVRRHRFVAQFRRANALASSSDAQEELQPRIQSLIGWAEQGSTRSLRQSVLVGRPTSPACVQGLTGSNRVNRGGSFNNDASNARAANRNNNDPSNRNSNNGFRLASTGNNGASAPAGTGSFTDDLARTVPVHSPLNRYSRPPRS
jgi:hypothetical protein